MLRVLDELAADNVAICVDEGGRLRGTVTDGDVRRGMLSGIELSAPIERFVNRSPSVLRAGEYTTRDVREVRERDLGIVPIVDGAGVVTDCINFRYRRGYVPVHAVLMAGGLGTRLRPLTLDTPKPMLEVGGKPLLEHNIDRLATYGVTHVSVSVNYLAEQIVDYFGDGSAKGISIDYLREGKPLGTVGSLGLRDGYTEEILLVMNGDLLTTVDYEAFFLRHLDTLADLTVGAVPYRVNVPFGVLDTEGDEVVAVSEKPTYDYLTNAGIYLFDASLLSHLPPAERYDATDLIASAKTDGRRVGYYPIAAYWLDIGRPADFARAQADVRQLS